MSSNNQTIILHTQIHSLKISLMQVNVTYTQKLKNISIFNYVHTYNFLHKILNAFKKVIHARTQPQTNWMQDREWKKCC